MRPANAPIFNALDAASTQTSPWFSLYQVYGWSGQINFTGSPAGTLKVQTSNDPGSYQAQTNLPVTNASDLDGSSLAVGAAGSWGWNYEQANYNWVRFVWTPSGGSGTISGNLNTKGA